MTALFLKIVNMNKKPAFWLILAAVAVCIAVAVCFLTSPRSGRDAFLDLNRNGIEEELRLVHTDYEQFLVVYENEEQIFCESGAYVHMGWNALFLCTLEGEDYLLRYNPDISQGEAYLKYELFSLENGQANIIKSNTVHFDTYFGTPVQSFDPDAIAAFMEEVNGYLAHSRQLLNTDEDLIATFEKMGRLEDNLWFLDDYPNVFVRDNTKSLLENLREFKKAMEAQQLGGEPERLWKAVYACVNISEAVCSEEIEHQSTCINDDIGIWVIS